MSDSVKSYLTEMNVPDDLAGLLFSVSPDNMVILSDG